VKREALKQRRKQKIEKEKPNQTDLGRFQIPLCSPLLPSPAIASAGSSAIRIAASLLAEPGVLDIAGTPFCLSKHSIFRSFHHG
jgi:hypothetical protein